MAWGAIIICLVAKCFNLVNFQIPRWLLASQRNFCSIFVVLSRLARESRSTIFYGLSRTTSPFIGLFLQVGQQNPSSRVTDQNANRPNAFSDALRRAVNRSGWPDWPHG